MQKKRLVIEDVKIVDDVTIMFNVKKADVQNGGVYKMYVDSFELIKM